MKVTTRKTVKPMPRKASSGGFDMLTLKGRYVCDCEIGKPPGPYHSCGRAAVVECRNPRYSIDLHFCERHRSRATEEGRAVTRSVKGVILKPIFAPLKPHSKG